MFLHVVIVVERFSSSALHEAVVEGFFEVFPCWVFLVFGYASGRGGGFP